MYRVLLDTNILLDSVIPNRPQHDGALALLNWCNSSGDYGFAAATSYNDAYYVLCRAYNEAIAREALERLLGLVAVAPVSAEECDRSLRSNEPDFEDGLVRACAELNGADFIITRDKDAFAGSKVKSVTAKEFLFTVDHEDRELLAALLGCETI